MFLDFWGCAPGLELAPRFELICGTVSNSITPFGDCMVFSVSMVVVAFICLPFALRNLDENVILQWIAIGGLTVMVSIWLYILLREPTFPTAVPVCTTSQANLIGVVLFNFAFMSTI